MATRPVRSVVSRRGSPPRTFTSWSSLGDTPAISTDQGSYKYSFENTNPDQTSMWQAHGTTYQQSPLGIDSWTDASGRTVKYIVTPAGTPVAYTTNGTWISLLTDQQGSVRAMARMAGFYFYDPYGGFRNVEEHDDNAHANTIHYAGAQYHAATGLYRMGVRWYDPGLGRFTSPDPSTKEANPYLYAGANPINNVDPLGTWTSDPRSAQLWPTSQAPLSGSPPRAL